MQQGKREKCALCSMLGYCLKESHCCRLQDVSKGYWGSTPYQITRQIPHPGINLLFPCEIEGSQHWVSRYGISLCDMCTHCWRTTWQTHFHEVYMCNRRTSIARQRCSKHASSIIEAVFSVWPVLRDYKRTQPEDATKQSTGVVE
jgi:hypothetical protein